MYEQDIREITEEINKLELLPYNTNLDVLENQRLIQKDFIENVRNLNKKILEAESKKRKEKEKIEKLKKLLEDQRDRYLAKYVTLKTKIEKSKLKKNQQSSLKETIATHKEATENLYNKYILELESLKMSSNPPDLVSEAYSKIEKSYFEMETMISLTQYCVEPDSIMFVLSPSTLNIEVYDQDNDSLINLLIQNKTTIKREEETSLKKVVQKLKNDDPNILLLLAQVQLLISENQIFNKNLQNTNNQNHILSQIPSEIKKQVNTKDLTTFKQQIEKQKINNEQNFLSIRSSPLEMEALEIEKDLEEFSKLDENIQKKINGIHSKSGDILQKIGRLQSNLQNLIQNSTLNLKNKLEEIKVEEIKLRKDQKNKEDISLEELDIFNNIIKDLTETPNIFFNKEKEIFTRISTLIRKRLEHKKAEEISPVIELMLTSYEENLTKEEKTRRGEGMNIEGMNIDDFEPKEFPQLFLYIRLFLALIKFKDKLLKNITATCMITKENVIETSNAHPVDLSYFANYPANYPVEKLLQDSEKEIGERLEKITKITEIQKIQDELIELVSSAQNSRILQINVYSIYQICFCYKYASFKGNIKEAELSEDQLIISNEVLENFSTLNDSLLNLKNVGEIDQLISSYKEFNLNYEIYMDMFNNWSSKKNNQEFDAVNLYDNLSTRDTLEENKNTIKNLTSIKDELENILEKNPIDNEIDKKKLELSEQLKKLHKATVIYQGKDIDNDKEIKLLKLQVSPYHSDMEKLKSQKEDLKNIHQGILDLIFKYQQKDIFLQNHQKFEKTLEDNEKKVKKLLKQFYDSKDAVVVNWKNTNKFDTSSQEKFNETILKKIKEEEFNGDEFNNIFPENILKFFYKTEDERTLFAKSFQEFQKSSKDLATFNVQLMNMDVTLVDINRCIEKTYKNLIESNIDVKIKETLGSYFLGFEKQDRHIARIKNYEKVLHKATSNKPYGFSKDQRQKLHKYEEDTSSHLKKTQTEIEEMKKKLESQEKDKNTTDDLTNLWKLEIIFVESSPKISLAQNIEEKIRAQIQILEEEQQRLKTIQDEKIAKKKGLSTLNEFGEKKNIYDDDFYRVIWEIQKQNNLLLDDYNESTKKQIISTIENKSEFLIIKDNQWHIIGQKLDKNNKQPLDKNNKQPLDKNNNNKQPIPPMPQELVNFREIYDLEKEYLNLTTNIINRIDTIKTLEKELTTKLNEIAVKNQVYDIYTLQQRNRNWQQKIQKIKEEQDDKNGGEELDKTDEELYEFHQIKYVLNIPAYPDFNNDKVMDIEQLNKMIEEYYSKNDLSDCQQDLKTYKQYFENHIERQGDIYEYLVSLKGDEESEGEDDDEAQEEDYYNHDDGDPEEYKENLLRELDELQESLLLNQKFVTEEEKELAGYESKLLKYKQKISDQEASKDEIIADRSTIEKKIQELDQKIIDSQKQISSLEKNKDLPAEDQQGSIKLKKDEVTQCGSDKETYQQQVVVLQGKVKEIIRDISALHAEIKKIEDLPKRKNEIILELKAEGKKRSERILQIKQEMQIKQEIENLNKTSKL